MHLPTTLADIGLGEVSDEDLMKAAKAATVAGEAIQNENAINPFLRFSEAIIGLRNLE